MALDSGDFHFRMVEILLELHRTQRSCIVRLERGSSKKQLAIVQGSLAFAESNLPEEHLAHVLIRLGLLPRKELKTFTGLMKSGKSSEEAAVLAGSLDDIRLQQGLCEQALVILASLFAWPETKIRLFDGEGLTRRRASLAVPLPQALVMAARRAAKDRTIPAAFQQLKGLIRGGPASGARATIPLNSAEAFAFAQVDKLMPVSQLLPVLPSGESRPEELVQCLLLLGLLRLEAPAPDQSGSSAGQVAGELSDQVDELLQRFEVANFYEILSLPPDASEEDVKAAYHEMAKLYHPDRFESKVYSADLRVRAEKLFTYITGAYATLSDPAARAGYDETRMQKESQVEAALQARAAVDSEKEKIAETLFRAGRAALRKGDFEKAVKQLRECVWLRPDVGRFHHYLGVAQAETPALRKEAEQHFLKAIALEQMSPESYLELGKLYLKVNLPSKAEAQFREALRWDPENPEALRMLEQLAGRPRK